MKAFISYSAKAKDRFLITWLADELNIRNIFVEGSNYEVHYDSEEREITNYNIRSADLFIGVIVGNGDLLDNPNVFDEWSVAVALKKPTVFLVEETVILDSRFRENIFYFNRSNPKSALDSIAKYSTELKTHLDKKNAAITILGTAALIALISKLDK